MAQTCIDKLLCENAWDCNVLVTDVDGNPIDTSLLQDGEEGVVFVLEEKLGYNFCGWVDEDDVPYVENEDYFYLDDNRYQFNSINCSKKYLAQFCAIRYTINLTSRILVGGHEESDSTCFEGATLTGYYGDVILISAPESTGCRFLYWKQGDTIISEQLSFSYVVTGDVEIYAVYESAYYKITVKPVNPAYGTCTGSGNYLSGDTPTIKAIPNEGCFFEKWDDGDNNTPRTITVVGNRTYAAYFGLTPYTIDIEGHVANGSVIGLGTYYYGDIAIIQAIPNSGYEFRSWIVREEGGATYYSNQATFKIEVKCNVYVTPTFSALEYTLTTIAKPDNGGSIVRDPNNITYLYNATVEITAVPATNYNFTQWSDGLLNPVRSVKMTNNVELVGYFEAVKQKYTVTVLLPDNSYSCSINDGYTNVAVSNGSIFSYYNEYGYVDDNKLIEVNSGRVLLEEGSVINSKVVDTIVQTDRTIVTITFKDTTTDTDLVTYAGYSVCATGTVGTEFEISPLLPEGVVLSSITILPREAFLDIGNRIIVYTVGEEHDENVILKVESVPAQYDLRVTMSPIDSTTSEQITLSMRVNGNLLPVFKPSRNEPVVTLHQINYNTPIEITAVTSQVGQYEFKYWNTSIGTFSSNSIQFNMNSNITCTAVYMATQQDET